MMCKNTQEEEEEVGEWLETESWLKLCHSLQVKMYMYVCVMSLHQPN